MPKTHRNPASDVARMVISIELVPRAEAGNLEKRPNTPPSAGCALHTGKL